MVSSLHVEVAKLYWVRCGTFTVFVFLILPAVAFPTCLDLRQLEIHAGKQRAKDVIEATGLPLKVQHSMN